MVNARAILALLQPPTARLAQIVQQAFSCRLKAIVKCVNWDALNVLMGQASAHNANQVFLRMPLTAPSATRRNKLPVRAPFVRTGVSATAMPASPAILHARHAKVVHQTIARFVLPASTL
jgi:hypothetical protein